MEPSTAAAANSTAKERERKCFIDGAFASMNDKMLTMIKSQQSETVSLVFIIFTTSSTTTNPSSLFFVFFCGPGGSKYPAFIEENEPHSASVPR